MSINATERLVDFIRKIEYNQLPKDVIDAALLTRRAEYHGLARRYLVRPAWVIASSESLLWSRQ